AWLHGPGTSCAASPAAPDPGCRASFQIACPVRCGFASQVVQQVPRIQAGVVTIVENEPDGVVADGFNGGNPYAFLAGLQRSLASAMSLHLRRRRKHAQILEGEFVMGSVVEMHVENARFGA